MDSLAGCRKDGTGSPAGSTHDDDADIGELLSKAMDKGRDIAHSSGQSENTGAALGLIFGIVGITATVIKGVMKMMSLSNYRKDDIDRKVSAMGARPLDVMLIGGTGSGKSTTLNSIFQRKVARVGDSYEPETMNISGHTLNEVLRLWDTPGLGDGVEKDKEHARNIAAKLHETFNKSDRKYGLIDLVLVVVDGSNRDMGTTYTLLTNVIIPNIDKSRILVAINQADLAMSGHHWDENTNSPGPELSAFLEDKADSIQRRVREAAGVDIIRPVCYSAERGWHIREVLDLIIDNIPSELRLPPERKIDAKAAAHSVDAAMNRMFDGLRDIKSRALDDLMHTGNFWLDESFSEAMTDVMGTMGGASGDLEFALAHLDDEDFEEYICEALDGFNSAVKDMYTAVDGARKDFWHHAGNSAVKEIYCGLQDLCNSLAGMAKSLGYVSGEFSSLMESFRKNTDNVLARINSR